MSLRTLYVCRETLDKRLTLGLLREYVRPEVPVWISLEPRAWLPERDSRYPSGRLPRLAPLARTLPDCPDDLPLLAASLFECRRWQHFHDAQPLSELCSYYVTWSLDAIEAEGACPLDALCSRQQVLTRQDYQRFGLAQNSALPTTLDVEHFYQNGKRLAWRIIP